MENGRVNHSWCMGVVSHSNDGLGGAVMELVVGKHVGTKPGGAGSMSGQSQEGLVACRDKGRRVW